nr:unnamed protein product [Spirometra erinaceieuropaei]
MAAEQGHADLPSEEDVSGLQFQALHLTPPPPTVPSCRHRFVARSSPAQSLSSCELGHLKAGPRPPRLVWCTVGPQSLDMGVSQSSARQGSHRHLSVPPCKDKLNSSGSCGSPASVPRLFLPSHPYGSNRPRLEAIHPLEVGASMEFKVFISRWASIFGDLSAITTDGDANSNLTSSNFCSPFEAARWSGRSPKADRQQNGRAISSPAEDPSMRCRRSGERNGPSSSDPVGHPLGSPVGI